MALEIEKRDGTAERVVLCGMILSYQVLAHVAAKWDKALFASRVGRLVGGWCVEHFLRYGNSPKDAIREYFVAWAETNHDKDAADSVARFLDTLGVEIERVKNSYQPQHVLDVAGVLFNRVRLETLKDALDLALRRGDVAAADQLVNATRKVEIGLGAGIDVLEDDEAWESALNYRPEVLIQYQGDLGLFFGQTLRRGGFVGIAAPEKRGKSVVMQDMVWTAINQGRKVAYFEAGDSTQQELLIRWSSRLLGRPLTTGSRSGLTYRIPTAIFAPSGRGRIATAEYEERFIEADATAGEVAKARYVVQQRAGPKTFKLTCHPTSTLSIAEMGSILDGWQRDSWLPDVICVDYPDILLMQSAFKDARDKVNEVWKALKAVSQTRHALVLVVTQTDAASYDADVMRRRHFSEDKRKYGHVTAMYALNQKDDEKRAGIYRINCLANRDSYYDESVVCHVAGCREIAMPFMVSTWNGWGNEVE